MRRRTSLRKGQTRLVESIRSGIIVFMRAMKIYIRGSQEESFGRDTARLWLHCAMPAVLWGGLTHPGWYSPLEGRIFVRGNEPLLSCKSPEILLLADSVCFALRHVVEYQFTGVRIVRRAVEIIIANYVRW